jgi:hypothetical protein
MIHADVSMLTESSRTTVPRGPLLLSGNHEARGNHDHVLRTDWTPRIWDARGFCFSAWCGHKVPRPMDCRLQGRINRGWNRAYGSILLLSCLLRPSTSSFALIFLHDLRPPSTTTAAELPPSRFKTTGSLASLRRLMGVVGARSRVQSEERGHVIGQHEVR